MMLVFTLLIAAAVVFSTVPAPAGIFCSYGFTFIFGPLLYFLAVWIGVVFAFVLALAAIEILAFIVGGGMRLLLP
jgi:hypothetical protein